MIFRLLPADAKMLNKSPAKCKRVCIPVVMQCYYWTDICTSLTVSKVQKNSIGFEIPSVAPNLLLGIIVSYLNHHPLMKISTILFCSIVCGFP